MLIKISELNNVFKVKPNSILHIGAHLTEELKSYEKFKWGEYGIIWVEAQEQLANQIKVRTGKKDKVINCLAWDEDNVEMEFNISNNSQSSSILELGTHKDTYPEINFVEKIRNKTKRLDSILNTDEEFELINIDVQGVELPVLKGLGKSISRCQYIYSEVNKKEVYKNCTLVKDLDLYLQNFDFKRIRTSWVFTAGWGDALYVKKPSTKLKILGKIFDFKHFITFPFIVLGKFIKF